MTRGKQPQWPAGLCRPLQTPATLRPEPAGQHFRSLRKFLAGRGPKPQPVVLGSYDQHVLEDKK